MKDKRLLGFRKFVAFDEDTDGDFIIPVYSEKDHRVINCEFSVMVHPCSDDPNGVIMWLSLMEK